MISSDSICTTSIRISRFPAAASAMDTCLLIALQNCSPLASCDARSSSQLKMKVGL